MKYKLRGGNYTFMPIETIFENRGIKDYTKFLNVASSDEYSYNNLINIKEGIELLLRHLENKSKIEIIIDCDVDGMTSSAILYNYIKDINKKSNIVYSVHKHKKHGLTDDIVIYDDIKLLILPDASSNDYEQHQELKEKGIDILVLDHHECEKLSENAVVINNQLSPNYQNKSLSGAGVVYKFIKAIDDYLFKDYSSKYLDLVALGNVGDGMNLYSKETRYYVKEGLKKVNNKFLKALIKENSFSLGDKYNIMNLGWVIAPRINGVIRTGTIEDKKAVFEAFIGIRKDYEDVAKLCSSIKRKQDNTVKSEMVSIGKNINGDEKYLILNVNDDLEQAYTGLVANKLKSKYKSPVLLYRGKKGEENIVGGSARGYEGGLKDLREVLNNSGLFIFCEGHPNSFGFEIHKDNIDKLKQYLDEVMKNIDITDGEEYEVDLVFENDEINIEIISEICKYEDEWGNQLDEPLFVFKDIELYPQDIQLLGKNIKNLVFTYNDVKFIKKFAKLDLYNDLTSNDYCKVNLIGKCINNNYKGKTYPQVEIVDLEIK